MSGKLTSQRILFQSRKIDIIFEEKSGKIEIIKNTSDLILLKAGRRVLLSVISSVMYCLVLEAEPKGHHNIYRQFVFVCSGKFYFIEN